MNRFLAVCGFVAITLSAFFLSGAGTVTENTETIYQYTLQDLRNLRDFLLARPLAEDLTNKQYDLKQENVIILQYYQKAVSLELTAFLYMVLILTEMS